MKYLKTIILFKPTDYNQMMRLRLNMGIVRDKKLDASMINLYPYKNNSIYFPSSNYISAEEIPNEWMEIFDVLF